MLQYKLKYIVSRNIIRGDTAAGIADSMGEFGGFYDDARYFRASRTDRYGKT